MSIVKLTEGTTKAATKYRVVKAENTEHTTTRHRTQVRCNNKICKPKWKNYNIRRLKQETIKKQKQANTLKCQHVKLM
jgi:formylmethanofuran dehydrogenase subunit E